MKKLLALTTLALTFNTAGAYAASLKGFVSDSMCAAKGKANTPTVPPNVSRAAPLPSSSSATRSTKSATPKLSSPTPDTTSPSKPPSRETPSPSNP
jgi:hypothetical protein